MRWFRYEAGGGETTTDRPGRIVQIKLGLPELAMTESRYGQDESGPAAHVHRRHEDCFWVLEGQLTFEVGAERSRMRAGPGDFALMPRGVVHTFRNERRGDARFLNFHAPDAGFVSQLRARASARDEDERRSAAEEFDTFDPSPDGGRPAAECWCAAPATASGSG